MTPKREHVSSIYHSVKKTLKLSVTVF